MRNSGPARRGLLLGVLAAPALAGCASPLPPLAAGDPDAGADALLARSSAAHGLAALPALHDIIVSYAGEWPGLIDRLQPVLVDKGFRGTSEERLLLRNNLLAQAHVGPQGRKQVVRRSDGAGQGEVRVWFNGQETAEPEPRAAAALVADGYTLFLLGPLQITRLRAAGRSVRLGMGGRERVVLDGVVHDCDVLRARVAPGLGFSEMEDLALFIDREDALTRRIRFSLNGLESTRGAIAEVDLFDHVARHGLRWPTRFHEHLLRPFPLPVHDWRLTGLEVNRGMVAADVTGPAFLGQASRPATPLA